MSPSNSRNNASKRHYYTVECRIAQSVIYFLHQGAEKPAGEQIFEIAPELQFVGQLLRQPTFHALALNQKYFLGERRRQRGGFDDSRQVFDQVFGFVGAVQDEHGFVLGRELIGIIAVINFFS